MPVSDSEARTRRTRDGHMFDRNRSSSAIEKHRAADDARRGGRRISSTGAKDV